MEINYFETAVDIECKNCGYKTTHIELRTYNWRRLIKDKTYTDIIGFDDWICPKCKKAWRDKVKDK